MPKHCALSLLSAALVAGVFAPPLAARQTPSGPTPSGPSPSGPTPSGQTPPSLMLDAATLRSTGDALAAQAKRAPDGIAFRILLSRPDGNEQLAVRVKSGQGEWHRQYADILVALSGEAEIVTGGTVVNGRETQPGEIRGDRVDGGRRQPFHAGDAIRVEPGIAHQFLLRPGAEFRYFVVKVKAAP